MVLKGIQYSNHPLLLLHVPIFKLVLPFAVCEMKLSINLLTCETILSILLIKSSKSQSMNQSKPDSFRKLEIHKSALRDGHCQPLTYLQHSHHSQFHEKDDFSISVWGISKHAAEEESTSHPIAHFPPATGQALNSIVLQMPGQTNSSLLNANNAPSSHPSIHLFIHPSIHLKNAISTA